MAGRPRGAFPSSGETCALPQRRLPSNPSGRGCFGGSETGIGMHERDIDASGAVPCRGRGGRAAGQAPAHGQRAGLSAGRRDDRPVRAGPRLFRRRRELGPALRRVRRGDAAVRDRARAAPRRLWAMRSAIFGLGAAQVAITGLVLGGASPWRSAWPGRQRCSPGSRSSLSSTAFALQVLEEKGELALRHGRLAFAVLLFQDLAAIPLIALVPLFAVSARGRRRRWISIGRPAGHRAPSSAVIVVGRYLLDGSIRIVARTRREGGHDGERAADRGRRGAGHGGGRALGVARRLHRRRAARRFRIPPRDRGRHRARSKGCCSASSSSPSACRSTSA